MPGGLVLLLLSSGVMAVGAAVASALSGSLNLSFTLGQNTVNLDLGQIPGIAVTFGGLFMFFKGLRQIIRTKI